MLLKLQSLLYTFENSTKCIKISFASNSFPEWLKVLLFLDQTLNVAGKICVICRSLGAF